MMVALPDSSLCPNSSSGFPSFWLPDAELVYPTEGQKVYLMKSQDFYFLRVNSRNCIMMQKDNPKFELSYPTKLRGRQLVFLV